MEIIFIDVKLLKLILSCATIDLKLILPNILKKIYVSILMRILYNERTLDNKVNKDKKIVQNKYFKVQFLE
jgi:hypothetical protein